MHQVKGSCFSQGPGCLDGSARALLDLPPPRLRSRYPAPDQILPGITAGIAAPAARPASCRALDHGSQPPALRTLSTLAGSGTRRSSQPRHGAPATRRAYKATTSIASCFTLRYTARLALFNLYEDAPH